MNLRKAVNSQSTADTFSERVAIGFTLYLCLSYIFRSVGMRNRMGWIFLGVFWIFEVLRYRGIFRITKQRLAYVWIGLVSLSFFLLPIANNGAKNIQSLIVDISFCVIYLLSSKIDENNYKTIITIFIRVGLFLALFISFCSMFPHIYSSYIAPHLAKVEMVDSNSTYERGYGVSIGGSTVYASYVISVGMFFCFADLLYGSKFRNKLVNTAYLVIYALGLFCSGRRGTPLGLALAMLLVYLITTPRNAKKLLKRAGLFIVIIFTVVLLINILVESGYLTRFVRSFEILLGGNLNINVINRLSSSRLFLWRNAWNLFLSSPIIGVGWGTFAQHVNTIVTNVHNCWLQFLCETGVIGFVCLSTPIIGLYVYSRLSLKRAVNDPDVGIRKNVLFVSTGVQLYLIIMITIEPVFYKDYYHMLFVLLLLMTEFGAGLERNNDYLGQPEIRNT